MKKNMNNNQLISIKKFRVFFHYNKPLSKKEGKHFWSVHFKKTCYTTEHIDCRIETESKINKIQPHVVMQGWAQDIDVFGNKITIL